MAALKSAIKQTSPALQDKLEKDRSRLQSLSKADREARGKAFFSKVYAQHAERILNSLAKTSGGDLSEFVVNSVYGDLLAEESILSAKDTALLEFACCYASGAYPQAKGHMYGSRNLGNSRKEIEGIVALSHAIANVLDVEMQREGTEEWAFLEKVKSW
jgi:alkylhydroperoxidase/carboxymuconolactone decarboxylase family protein YurZ